jgi:hypothetical protein
MEYIFKTQLESLFGEVLEYEENVNERYIQFIVKTNAIRYPTLDSLSKLLNTEYINFTGNNQNDGSVSWYPQSQPYGYIKVWAVLFPNVQSTFKGEF